MVEPSSWKHLHEANTRVNVPPKSLATAAAPRSFLPNTNKGRRHGQRHLRVPVRHAAFLTLGTVLRGDHAFLFAAV